jgi:hypothetical protein
MGTESVPYESVGTENDGHESTETENAIYGISQ